MSDDIDDSMILMKGGFWHVADVFDMRAALPIVFSPTLRLEKANAEQIEHIYQRGFATIGGLVEPRRFYENSWTRAGSSNAWRYVPTPIAQMDWRYYVVSFAPGGFSEFAQLFESVANLGEPPLNFLLYVLTEQAYGLGGVRAWGCDFTQSIELYQHGILDPVVFDEAAADGIKSAYAALMRLDFARFSTIPRALRAFQALKRLPRSSDLLILGLFSIVEMLLTHNPNNKEIGDSLMHQIRSKIALLSPRFATPLLYTPFANAASEDKVWNALYHFRSQVAHGGEINFVDNQLRTLIDRDTAIDFLTTATRRLLRHSLDEPQLIYSLKPI
jgi:hypothetical protein